jgi:hypothetical protein
MRLRSTTLVLALVSALGSWCALVPLRTAAPVRGHDTVSVPAVLRPAAAPAPREPDRSGPARSAKTSRSPRTVSIPLQPPHDDELAHEAPGSADDADPERQAWRTAWNVEGADAQWTERVRDDTADQAEALLAGAVTLHELDCRETICRAQIQFADQLDAAAFSEAPRDPAQRYAFVSLDPAFDGAGFDRSEHTYELLIARERPADLPRRTTPFASESFANAEP